ncbi:MAG: D-tyrosyl-tRNA(Tyr) deacylase [Chloroflexi bacterium]|nr:D-tyrosyl-tRNA(Tyr) deacylase [Chloroflexota bacterium]
MRALLQRVSQASVSVEGSVVGNIGPGLLVFLGVGQGDTETDACHLVDKVSNLRIFADRVGKLNLSLLDIEGEALVVSQFTLLADTRKGRRPNFIQAAPPEIAQPLVDSFVLGLREAGLKVETGQFQAHMMVKLCNDGPVTLMLDSKE